MQIVFKALVLCFENASRFFKRSWRWAQFIWIEKRDLNEKETTFLSMYVVHSNHYSVLRANYIHIEEKLKENILSVFFL